MSDPLLHIEDLHVSVEGRPVLRGVDLRVRAGEVHAVMGPNGSGKSTLAHAVAGREGYEVTSGRILYRGEDLAGVDIEERAARGLFLGFQYPVEIPGVSNRYFMRAAVNAVRQARGEEEIGAVDFLARLKEAAARVEMEERFLTRAVNDGFSGGEKKRNEILQMTLLDPVLAVLDETDSGLDVDALRVVARGIQAQRRGDNAFLLITHYQRLLDHVAPDVVHVLVDGRVAESGGPDLPHTVEREGYARYAATEGA